MFFIYNIGISHTVIAEDITIAIKHTVVTADFLTCFYSFRGLAAFFLCQSSHKRQSQFAVTVHCPNVILNEKDLYAYTFKLSCDDKRINNISGKTTNLSGND